MSIKDTVFYRQNTEVLVDFSAQEISTDGAILLLEKLERKHQIIKGFSKIIPEWRDASKITHTIFKLLKQKVLMLIQGYEDNNDVSHLKNDPVFKDILEGDLASQPTMSRFENSIDLKTIFAMSYWWIDDYVSSLKGRNQIVIDIDGTDAQTYGEQQLSLFNGFYGHFMYNELFFHDGQTGQIICPVLRPGNSHSNRWYVGILRRIIERIKKQYPAIEIIIRADAGFSCPGFYSFAEKFQLKYAIGIAGNSVLKKRTAVVEKAVRLLYASQHIKHQHFTSFSYQAGSWENERQCISKVESTGKGMNIRYIMSNIGGQDAREIYTKFYCQRGDASENRIKEVKNMCFSDRLSNHSFLANCFRLFISSLAYKFFLLIKTKISQTKHEKTKTWQIDTIRTMLLKVGATIKITKRRVYYHLSKSFVYKGLFRDLILLE